MKPSEQIEQNLKFLLDLAELEDSKNTTVEFMRKLSGATAADSRKTRTTDPKFWIAAIVMYLDQKEGSQ